MAPVKQSGPSTEAFEAERRALRNLELGRAARQAARWTGTRDRLIRDADAAGMADTEIAARTALPLGDILRILR